MNTLPDEVRVFFDLLPPAVRNQITPSLRRLQFRSGRTVLDRGESSTAVFFILKGAAQVTLYSSGGREVAVRQIGAGDLFGDLAALDGRRRSAMVLATQDLQLLAISQSDFISCLESSPGAALWLARRLGTEVRRLTEQVFELSALPVQARLHCELLRLARSSEVTGASPTLRPAPTHLALANRIGTHREAVTRELSELSREGVVRVSRRTVEFLDLPWLERSVGRAVGDHI